MTILSQCTYNTGRVGSPLGGMKMNRLRELRIKADMTLDDIQKQTGINRGTYNNYETGKTEPKLKTALSLANFFHVTPQYLVGWTDDPRA